MLEGLFHESAPARLAVSPRRDGRVKFGPDRNTNWDNKHVAVFEHYK
ncbi:MAG: hypothetical protein ACLFS7_05270 [Desulfosudaceae bacterium]